MNTSSRYYFYVDFRGYRLRADSIDGNKGHVLMIHGGSKDREAGVKYRHLMASLSFGSTRVIALATVKPAVNCLTLR